MVMIKNVEKELVEEIIDTVIDNFKENEAKINDMNVFPVPDGDTGTNMLLTLKSIREEIAKINNPTLKSVLENASMGALMGARGNSGVILSQIVKGFFDILIRSGDFNLDIIKEALKSSRDVAYGSVQNPTEGTMLTIIKDIHSHVEKIYEKNEGIKLEKLLDSIIEETEKSVERTTFLLPVLKQANVVDAGARGVLDILIGVRYAFSNIDSINGNMNIKLIKGKSVSGRDSNKKESEKEKQGDVIMENIPGSESEENMELKEVKLKSEIKYTYCTEMILKGNGINVERLREKIESYGDSAMIVGNENVVKIHVHTNSPQKVLSRAIREGTLHEISISNMKDQREEVAGAEDHKHEGEAGPALRKAVVVVANGEGIEQIFKSIGVDEIISGGQSMNPSTYDIVKAINNLDASEIIIFPNNKNIILTANQAKKLVKKKTVTVVPTRTIPEGIMAVLTYNQDLGVEENLYNIGQSIKRSKCGEVTRAVRDAKLFVGEIKKGAYIGFSNGQVRVVSDSIIDATTDLIRDMMEGNEEVITIYTGIEAESSDIKDIKKKIKDLYPDIDIEIHRGGQPLYPFIFSIE
jgi:uncharacterized protein